MDSDGLLKSRWIWASSHLHSVKRPWAFIKMTHKEASVWINGEKKKRRRRKKTKKKKH